MCEFGKSGGEIAKDFAIHMLLEYEEDDGSTLMWCQEVVDVIRESKEKHVFVKIEWSDKLKITKNQLKKTKWNPSSPVGGAWQEDLYHKLMNKE